MMWRVNEMANTLKRYAILNSYDVFRNNRSKAAEICFRLLEPFEGRYIITMLFREGLGDCLYGAPYSTADELTLLRARVRRFSKQFNLDQKIVDSIVDLIALVTAGVGVVERNPVEELFRRQQEKQRRLELQKKNQVSIQSQRDFYELTPSKVEDLYISSSYKDETIPSLAPFINLRKLSGFYPMSWQQVAEINMQALKELYFTNTDCSIDICLDAPMLEYLTICNQSEYEELTPLEKMLRTANPRLQFKSGNLKRLELNHFSGYDLSAISELPHLEELTIRNTDTTDLGWLADCKSLKKLYIFSNIDNIGDIPGIDSLQELYLDYAGIESIDGINFFPKLQILCLRGNRISEIQDPTKLNHLRRLDLTRNPISAKEDIAGLSVPELVRTDFERELFTFDRKLEAVFAQAYYTYLHREKNIDKLAPFAQSKWKNKSEIERYLWMANEGFENSFYSFNPSVCGADYNPEIKRLYLDFVEREYPFLRVTEDLEKQIQREYLGFSYFYREEPGYAAYVNQSIYIVRVQFLTEGKGIHSKFSNTAYQSIGNKALETLIRDNCPYLDLQHTKVDIEVFDLYRTGRLDGIEVGIIAAIHSLWKKKAFPVHSFISGEYRGKGLFKKQPPSSLTIALANSHGAQRVVFLTSGKVARTVNKGTRIECHSEISCIIE